MTQRCRSVEDWEGDNLQILLISFPFKLQESEATKAVFKSEDLFVLETHYFLYKFCAKSKQNDQFLSLLVFHFQNLQNIGECNPIIGGIYAYISRNRHPCVSYAAKTARVHA